MKNDEHEMMVEFSEITAFSYDPKKFQELQEDLEICKKKAYQLEWFLKNLVNSFKSEYGC